MFDPRALISILTCCCMWHPIWSVEPKPVAPLMNASSLSDVVLKTSTYQDYKIGGALNSRKVMLLIFPGGWDVYSVHALKVLRNVEASLAQQEIQIIAVCMDSPLEIKGLLENHDIPFVIASDTQNIVARKLDALTPLDDARESQLRSAGIDVRESSGEAGQVGGEIPLLRLCVFDQQGTLVASWTSTDADTLISADTVLEMAARLNVLPPES